MKKLITLLLLFTLVGFLSGNQVIITNDYEYIVSEGKTYNFSNGNESNNVKYDRTNKIAIQNNKVIADLLKYHYAFFWDEADSFIGYYKTNKGITTSGEYLGQVNTQSIPLPLNAYSFALVRYDNDYVLVNGFTIEELFIDNNLADVDPDDFNNIPIAELNNNSLNDIFDRTILKTTTALPNGVKYYEISGGNIVQRVQQYSLIADDVISIFNVFSNIDYVVVLTPLDSAERGNRTALLSILQGFTNTASFGNDISFVGTFTKAAANNEYYVGVSKGLYPTLASAKTAFTGLGLIYQLATPITILNDVSIDQAALDTYYQIWLNGVNATYYATDGNVSSVDGHYYAAGKNLFDENLIKNGRYNTFPPDIFNLNANSRGTEDFIQLKNNTTYTLKNNGVGLFFWSVLLFYDNNYVNTRQTNYGENSITFTTQSNEKYIRFSSDRTVSDWQLEQGGTATSYEAFATPTTTLNLTFLFGVGNEPDKATMDGYYAEYEEYLEYLYVCCNIFATQTISFETIYFDDGVSTEIERLGSILIFTLIGFTLMIFGFASKRRIFNLLSVGAFVVLGVLLAEFAGFLIIVFGLVVLNLYYTFLGDI
jgi:hypothetical protein